MARCLWISMPSVPRHSSRALAEYAICRPHAVLDGLRWREPLVHSRVVIFWHGHERPVYGGVCIPLGGRTSTSRKHVVAGAAGQVCAVARFRRERAPVVCISVACDGHVCSPGRTAAVVQFGRSVGCRVCCIRRGPGLFALRLPSTPV